jgi:protein-L-isoaspartate O-methyltransferase
MIIPVGSVFGPQYLTLVEKSPAGEVKTRQLLAVRFVPLTRGAQ